MEGYRSGRTCKDAKILKSMVKDLWMRLNYIERASVRTNENSTHDVVKCSIRGFLEKYTNEYDIHRNLFTGELKSIGAQIRKNADKNIMDYNKMMTALAHK